MHGLFDDDLLYSEYQYARSQKPMKSKISSERIDIASTKKPEYIDVQ